MSTPRRRYLKRLGEIGGVASIGALTGCTSGNSTENDEVAVRIGSKSFPEQEILGYLAYERFQTADKLTPVDKIGYGNSLANWQATITGEKHLYWEYTGTAWTELPPTHDERISNPDRLFHRVKADAIEQGLRMDMPAEFSNEYVIIADQKWAKEASISTLSGLSAYINENPADIGVALGEEFYHRDDGWVHLLDHYGVQELAQEKIESNEFFVTSIGLTYELLERNDIHIASGFATDPQIDRPGLVRLLDDRDFFLPYQPVPTAYASIVDDHPVIFEALTPVLDALDESVMRRLNRQVIFDDRRPSDVASQFLEDLDV